MSEIWKTYYETTHQKEPHKLLMQALPYVKNKGLALDLGAGAGRDTRHLLQEGFQVDVVEQDEDANPYLPHEATVTNASFADFSYPEARYDFVNAQFALPFNPPESFERVFGDIKKSLRPGGILAGQFFGTEDDWARNPSMSFHTKEDAQRLLNDLTVHLLEEVRKEDKTADGKPKFWHYLNFIAERT